MTQLICPTCKKHPASNERGVWPFCSVRCKQIDLGNWASERYRVPARATGDEDLDDEVSRETDNED